MDQARSSSRTAMSRLLADRDDKSYNDDNVVKSSFFAIGNGGQANMRFGPCVIAYNTTGIHVSLYPLDNISREAFFTGDIHYGSITRHQSFPSQLPNTYNLLLLQVSNEKVQDDDQPQFKFVLASHLQSVNGHDTARLYREDGPFIVLFFKDTMELIRSSSLLSTFSKTEHHFSPVSLKEVEVHSRFTIPTRVPRKIPFFSAQKTSKKAKIIAASKQIPNANQVFYEYPPESERSQNDGKISLSMADLNRLVPGEFLNDNLIDFYFQMLSDSFLPRDSCYVFTTHFYSTLASAPDEETRYERVRKWSDNIDLLSKSFILIPIHESVHWSLIVICNPSAAFDDVVDLATEEDDDSLAACFIAMDSLACHDTLKFISVLRGYLRQECLNRRNKVLSFDSMPIVVPKLPMQSNSFDCGVYMLMYATVLLSKTILQDNEIGVTRSVVENSMQPILNDKIFRHECVNEFRDYLRQVICSLKVAAANSSSLNFIIKSKEVMTNEVGIFSFVTSS